MQKGVTISVTVTGKATTGTLYVEILDSSGSRLKYMSFGSTEQTQTISYESPADGTYYIKAYCDAGNRTASLSGTYSFSGYFEPNWWVDLKTGKMVAAKGNFVVDANGDVHVKSGDVDVKGTIRATSFFRNMNFGDNSKVWKHVWSDGTEDITATYYSSGDDAWDSSLGVYLVSQTYYGNADTDIFYVNNEDVFIPNPDNWEGKQVEIYNAGASSNGSMRVKSNNNTRSTLMRWPLMAAFSGDLSCGDASYIRMVCRRDNGYNYWYIIEYRKYDGTLYLPNV